MKKILSMQCVAPTETASRSMAVENPAARIKETYKAAVIQRFDKKAPQTGQEEMYGCRPRRLISCISGGRNDFFSRTQEIAK